MRGVLVAGEGLVLGLCVEAGLVALAALLAEFMAGHSGHHSAHDGTDDCAGSARAVKAARGVEAASGDESHQPDWTQCEVGDEYATGSITQADDWCGDVVAHLLRARRTANERD